MKKLQVQYPIWIQMALTIGIAIKWEVHHMDVKNVFLHVGLKRKYTWNCKLKKSLYGLK